MKNYKSLSMAFTLATASVVGMAPGEVAAQGIQAEVKSGLSALKLGQWEKSRTIFEKITSSLGEEKGRKQFGSKFGEIYYFQGLSERNAAKAVLKAGDKKKADELFRKSVQSFDNCYAFPSKAGKSNKFEKKCLKSKGESLQDLGDYAGAVQAYEKFQAEGGAAAKKNLGGLSMKMAICYFKLEEPDFKKGIRLFEAALKNKARWKTHDAAIVKGFQALAEGAIKVGNEQAILDFLKQNRGALTLQPNQMAPFTPFFQKLGSQALGSNMPAAAFSIFALVPDTKTAQLDIEDVQRKLADYPLDEIKDGGVVYKKATLEQQAQKLQELKASGDPPEVFALVALAYMHEKNGHIRGAKAAYELLERHYKKSSKREDNLFGLIRTSAQLGDIASSVRHGSVFRKRFPDSKHIESVSNMMLSTLFSDGKYKDCEKVAEQLIGDLKKGELPHDVCLFVLGGSKYYLGKNDEAAPLLEEHVKTYPKSDFANRAAYFEASNLVRVGRVGEATKKLDAFIKNFPNAKDNPFLSYAMLDRAKMHFKKGEKIETLRLLGRIQSEFAGSTIVDATYNIAGDVHKMDKKPEEAKAAYLKGFELAKKNDNKGVAATSLFKLVRLVGKKSTEKNPNPNIKDAVPYYDSFWKDYSKSPFHLEVAMDGIYPLIAAGRLQDGLNTLEAAISLQARTPKAIGLERAVKKYTKHFIEQQQEQGKDTLAATEALKTKFIDFKDIAKDDVRTRALLELQVIASYQKAASEARKAKNQELVDKSKARIASAFNKLKANFPVETLPESGLIDLGYNLLKGSASPRQALPYFEERLKRPKKKDRNKAVFGIAEVYSLAGNDKELRKALEMMQKLIDENPNDRKVVAQASAVMVEVYFRQENWDKVIESANNFIANTAKSPTKIRVTQLLSEAYLKQSKYSDAIGVLVNLHVNNRPNWVVSVPALEQATNLIWKHGQSKDGKSNKQVAYDLASGYITSSRKAFDENKLEMPGEVRESWLRIEKDAQKWAGSGEVTVPETK